MVTKPSVYITYAKADYNANPYPLDAIVSTLEKLEYDLWYDGYLKSNQSFQSQLLENSFSREVFIALLGVNTIPSTWVHREIDTARAGDAAFIPIIIDEQFTINDLRGFFLEGYNTHFFSESLLDQLPIMIDTAATNVRETRLRKATSQAIWGMPAVDTQHQCDIFMAMPFKDYLEPVYKNHISKVANKLNYTLKRGDDPFAEHDIMNDVWSLVYNCQLVIADCTERNPNVFYEMGIAHTLGKPIIPITQNRVDIPFDIRGKRYIEYKYDPENTESGEIVAFEEELERAIQSLLKKR